MVGNYWEGNVVSQSNVDDFCWGGNKEIIVYEPFRRKLSDQGQYERNTVVI